MPIPLSISTATRTRGHRRRRSSVASGSSKRQRTNGRRKPKITRSIVPKVYTFKRKVLDEVTASDAASPGAGWLTTGENCLTTTMIFALNQVPNPTDFTNLFAEYRIKSVRTKIWCGFVGNVNQNTAALDGMGINIRFQFASNRTGQAVTVADTLNDWAEKQMVASTQRGFNNELPVVLNQGLNQLSMVFHTAIDTDYVVKRPSWSSTTESGTPYYGYDLIISSLSNDISLGPGASYRNANFKLEHEFTIECRGVN